MFDSMAALLRVGGGSICRLLAVYAVRNPQICRRFRLNAYKEHVLKACRPSFGALRHLSLSSDPSQPQVLESEEGEASVESPKDFTPEAKVSEEEYKYRRDVKNLGVIAMKRTLVSTFKEICKREGAVSSFQAYQILYNCVSKLVYEKPQERIDLAHYFWDKMMEAGLTPDAMLYNALLSVYIYNNHTFNPMEVLEQMKKDNIEANRTTLVLMMQAFGEMGDVAGTFKVLEFIKDVDMPLTEEIYASLITAYGLSGDFENAKGVFDLMRENGLEPDIASYIALLCVHGDKGDIDAINKIIDEMQEKRVYPNQNVFVALLNVLSRRGHVAIIKELLENFMIKNLVKGDLKNLMINVAIRGELNSAFAMLAHVSPNVLSSASELSETLPRHLPPDIVLLRAVIYSDQPQELVLITINELERLGTMKNIHEMALEYCFNTKNTELSLEILREMLRKEIPIRIHYFYPLLACHARDRKPQEAQAVVDLMARNGFELDSMTLKYLVRSFGQPDTKDVEAFISMTQNIQLSPFFVRLLLELVMQTGQMDLFLKLITYAKKESVEPLYVMQAFQNRLKSRFEPETAVQILKILDSEDYLPESTPGMISSCIDSCSESTIQDMLNFVVLVHKEGLHHHLDSRAYSFLLRQLCHAQMSDEFYEFVRIMKEYNIELDRHHYRQIIKMMAFDGKSDAANFCFEKYKELAEPDGLIYSAVIQASGSCREGGIISPTPKQKNMKRICRLFKAIEEKQLEVTKQSKGYTIIANLMLGNIDEAERIRKQYGPGEPEYRVHSEFLKAYSRRGNVAKCKELFEMVKSLNKIRNVPQFVFNNMLYVYGFHGDYKSQREILQEMKQRGVAPNVHSYAEVMKCLLMKDNIESALEVLEEARKEGSFTSHGGCLLLLNSMARTGQTEHFESVLDTIVTTTKLHSFGQRKSNLGVGLLFACLHAGRKDLALKLQLEADINVFNGSFTNSALSSASRGEYYLDGEKGHKPPCVFENGWVDAILIAIEFMKERGVSHTELYLPLIKAYDTRRDPNSARALYEELKAEGVKPGEEFLRVLNKILRKYSEPVPADLQNGARSSLEKQDVLEADAANDDVSHEEESSTSDSASDSDKA